MSESSKNSEPRPRKFGRGVLELYNRVGYKKQRWLYGAIIMVAIALSFLVVTLLRYSTAQSESFANEACSNTQNENLTYMETIANEMGFTVIHLEYITSVEGIDSGLQRLYSGEFTWFEALGTVDHRFAIQRVRIERIRTALYRNHGFLLPEFVTLDANSFLVISIGRRLQILYYSTISHTGYVRARPVFEEEYYPETVFIFRASPLPRHRFTSLPFDCDNLAQFNNFNNIPFEIWPASWHFSQTEKFEEPVFGHVNVYEVFLRQLPTEKSDVRIRLFYGQDLTVQGYVEDGENIGGCSRWYFVRTARGYSVFNGFVHSSYVTFW